jgi:hypothetical protein
VNSTIHISYRRPDGDPITLDELSEFVSGAFAAGCPGGSRLNVRMKGFTGRMNAIETDSAAAPTAPTAEPEGER